MKQPIEVVMLPTEDITNLVYVSESKSYHLLTGKEDSTDLISNLGICQHIYITVSQDVEPIKEGDWYYAIVLGVKTIQQCEDDEHAEECKIPKFKARKIIATTDPKIKTTTVLGNDGTTMFTKIPQVPQSFLKEFVANPDVKWEVEYEDKVNPLKLRRTPNGISVAKAVNQALFGLKPKLNKDNTILLTIKTNSRCQIE